MAAPQITALAATILEDDLSLSVAQLKEIIFSKTKTTAKFKVFRKQEILPDRLIKRRILCAHHQVIK